MKKILLIAALGLSSTAWAGEYESRKNEPYLGPDRREKMDVYQPPATFARPTPAVIWIHGGSWTKGDKAAARERNVCETLAANGYVAFSINYRLGEEPAGDGSGIPAGGVPWPQNFYDCKSALRYIRKEAARLGVDPNRIAVTGGSAGGHLALLTGLTADVAEMNKGGSYNDQDNHVSCIIDFYSVAEISDKVRAAKFAGATPEETRENLRTATPLTHLGKATPPILIVHGTADKTVDISASRSLDAALQRLGLPHQFIEVPGAGHAFDLQPKEMDLRPTVLDFLGKYLGRPKQTQ